MVKNPIFIFIISILLFSSLVFGVKPVEYASLEDSILIEETENNLKNNFHSEKVKELKIKGYEKISGTDYFDIDITSGDSKIKLYSLKNPNKVYNISIINKRIKFNNKSKFTGTDVLTIEDPDIENAFITLEKKQHTIGKQIKLLYAEDNINFVETNQTYYQNDTHIWFNTTHFSSWTGSFPDLHFYPEFQSNQAINLEEELSASNGDKISAQVYDPNTDTSRKVEYTFGSGYGTEFDALGGAFCDGSPDSDMLYDFGIGSTVSYFSGDIFFVLEPYNLNGESKSNCVVGPDDVDFTIRSSGGTLLDNTAIDIYYDPDYTGPQFQDVSPSSSGVTQTSATLYGKVLFQDLSRIYNYLPEISQGSKLVFLLYREKDSGDAFTVKSDVGTASDSATFSYALSSLDPDTTYEFKWNFYHHNPLTDSTDVLTSNTFEFTTLTAVPTVETLSPSIIGDTTATLRAVVSYNSFTGDVYRNLAYSDTEGSGYNAEATPMSIAVDGVTLTREITGLDPCTIYYPRTFIYEDAVGSTFIEYDDGNSFKTTGCSGGSYIFQDDFNRADSATVGNGWTEAGDAQILSNKAYMTTGGSNIAYADWTTPATAMEWTLKSSSIGSLHDIRLQDEVGDSVIYLQIVSGNLIHYDGSNNNIETLSSNIEYVIKITDIDVSAETYKIQVNDGTIHSISSMLKFNGANEIRGFRHYIDSASNLEIDDFKACEVTCEPAKEKPTVLSDNADQITYNSARLVGVITNMGDYTSFNTNFQYKLNSSSTWINESCTENITATGFYYCSLTGLSEDSTYDWRYFADLSDQDDEFSFIRNFTTSEKELPQIQIVGPIAEDISATLRGSVLDFGGYSSDDVEVFWKYKKSSSGVYSSPVGLNNVSVIGAVSHIQSGLEPETEYEVVFLGTVYDGAIETSISGFSLLFNTTAEGEPVISTESATDIERETAQLNGDITDLGTFTEVTCNFQYYNEGNTTKTNTSFIPYYVEVGIGQEVTDLFINTTYYYEFKCFNTAREYSGTGGLQSFTTLSLEDEIYPEMDLVLNTTTNESITIIYTIENTDAWNITYYIGLFDDSMSLIENKSFAVTNSTFTQNSETFTGLTENRYYRVQGFMVIVDNGTQININSDQLRVLTTVPPIPPTCFDLVPNTEVCVDDPYLFVVIMINAIILVSFSFPIVAGSLLSGKLDVDYTALNKFLLYGTLAMSVFGIIWLWLIGLIPEWQVLLTISGLVFMGLYNIIGGNR